MKQGLIPETKDETSPIKALASNVLQRIQRNKHETTGHLSVSVPSQSTFPENSKNRPTKLTDSTDKCEKEGGLSVMSVSSLQEEREERLAIVEHEGQQSPLQAHKIAYQDAFIGILVSLPEQHSSPNISLNEWLDRRIHSAKAWLTTQEYIANHKGIKRS